MAWTECTLGDVLTLKRGYDLPSHARRTGSIPIVSSSGVSGFHDTPRVAGPGVVTGRYGTLGEVFYVRSPFWPLNTALYVQDFKGNSPRFVSYLLTTLGLGRQNAAGAIPGVNRNHLHGMAVAVPDVPSQVRIAKILASFDDLIENNTRRIAILEEMAQAIYREWFVQFRFPGYQRTKFIESELGSIPRKWAVAQLGDIADEVRRSVNPNEVDADTPYFGLEHFPRQSIALAEWGRAGDVQSTKLAFRKGEILFGKIRPYFHKVGVAPVSGICSTDAIVIVPRSSEYHGLVLSIVSSEAFVAHATQTSQGTKMPRANWNVLVSYPVAVPPKQLLSRFNEIVRSVVQRIMNLIYTNRNLRQTRDLLLPKLVSGEIEIREAEEELTGAA